MELQLPQILFIIGLYQNQIKAEDILQICQMWSKVYPDSPSINAPAPSNAARYILAKKLQFIVSMKKDKFPNHIIVKILDVWQKAFAPHAACITEDDVTFATTLHSSGLTSREIAGILWERRLKNPDVRVLSRTVCVSSYDYSNDVLYQCSRVGDIAHIRLEHGIYHIQMKTHSQAAELVHLYNQWIKWGHSFAQRNCKFDDKNGVCSIHIRDLSDKDIQKLADSVGVSCAGSQQLHPCMEEPDAQDRTESMDK